MTRAICRRSNGSCSTNRGAPNFAKEGSRVNATTQTNRDEGTVASRGRAISNDADNRAAVRPRCPLRAAMLRRSDIQQQWDTHASTVVAPLGRLPRRRARTVAPPRSDDTAASCVRRRFHRNPCGCPRDAQSVPPSAADASSGAAESAVSASRTTPLSATGGTPYGDAQLAVALIAIAAPRPSIAAR